MMPRTSRGVGRPEEDNESAKGIAYEEEITLISRHGKSLY